VIRLETGATAGSTSDAMVLIHLYGIEDKERVNDLLTVTRTQPEAWWDGYSEHYPQRFINFLAYEDTASVLRQFQAVAIPGLLQTRNYAFGVFDAYLEGPGRIDRAWEVRSRRQKLLERDDGTRFEFLLDEAVLRRNVGGTDVMIEQLTRIKELNDRENPLISIPGMKGSFTIFEYSAEDEDFIVNVEEPNSDVLIRDNPETTSNYFEAFADLEAIALSRAETSEMLSSVIESMRSSQTG
jgi:hypothetical protein